MTGAILNQAEVTGSTGIIDLPGDKKKRARKNTIFKKLKYLLGFK
jgi:hypothetical protein